jgi:hypothetical protein
MSKEQLELAYCVIVAGEGHSITFRRLEQPNNEYKIRPYRFKDDELAKEADGCLFEIKPHGSTRVVKIIDEEFSVLQTAIKGKGWCLTRNPEGEVTAWEVGEDMDENPQMEMSKGWAYCWIAGREDLEVLDLSQPPFDPKVEIVIEEGADTLPEKFWIKHLFLKTKDY